MQHSAVRSTLSGGVRSLNLRRAAGRWLALAMATLLALVFIVPFLWTISSSLKSAIEIHVFPPKLLPEQARWMNYIEVFSVVPMANWIFNSLFVTLLSLVGIVLSASVVAYSFARFRYPGRDLFFMITLSTMMLPIEVLIIPQYLLFNRLGWLNTFKPLIIPHWFGGGAFNIFLLRQFFMAIPRDLDEAAVIDGASYLKVFMSILVPLSKPVVATVAVITFIDRWNAFLGPLIFLDSRDKLTMAVGLRLLQTITIDEGEPKDHYLMAAAVIMAVPTIALFFSAQRYFVRGVVMSGIKG